MARIYLSSRDPNSAREHPLEEFTNKTFRIDTNDEVSLPVIGHLQVDGFSLARLELECRDRLKHILKDE